MNPQRSRLSYFWLYVGASSTAIALGYMVGASNSPVVASVVPAGFALVVAALGLLQGRGHRTASGDHEGNISQPEIPKLGSASGIRPLGITLTVFALTYLGATIVGTQIRTLTLATDSAPFPWTQKNRPTKTQTALEWLVVQKRLVAYGYTVDQVRQVYELSQSMVEPKPTFDFPKSVLDSVPEPGAILKRPEVGPGILAKHD